MQEDPSQGPPEKMTKVPKDVVDASVVQGNGGNVVHRVRHEVGPRRPGQNYVGRGPAESTGAWFARSEVQGRLGRRPAGHGNGRESHTSICGRAVQL